MNCSEKQRVTNFCTSLPKKEKSGDNVQKMIESPFMAKSPQNDPKRKKRLTKTKRACINNKLQLQHPSSAILLKKEPLRSATSFLSRSFMTYNITASMDKRSCTDYVDFDKCQQIWTIFVVQNCFQILGWKTQGFQET